jgi:hypothetical protein
VSDGIEWLASYYLHSVGMPSDHDLSTTERVKYAAKGARKIYELIKNKPIKNLSVF